MTDIERIEFIFADFEEKMRGNYFRDPVAWQEPLESIRVRYWYESLRQRYSLSGPAKMEAYLEPCAVKWDTAGRKKYSNNKWGHYRDGRMPRCVVLKRVEKIAPGSMRIFNHPLWNVLDFDNLQIMEGDAFLQSLSSELQAVLFNRREIGINSYLERAKVNGSLLRKLELKAGLDVLACLVWLLREASVKQCDNVKEIGGSLHSVLVMMAIELQDLKVSLPLLQHFINRVLPLSVPLYQQLAITPFQYLELSFALNILVFNVEGQSKILQWRDRVKCMRRLLDGNFGLQVPLAMAMPVALNRSLSYIPPTVVKKFKVFAWSSNYGRERLFGKAVGSIFC